MFLTTKELEKYIQEKIKLLNESSIEPHYFNDETRGDEGVYVYSNLNGYHYVISERGSETQHKITYSVFEITFWTLEGIVSEISYHSVPKDVQGDKRRYVFNKMIELLARVGDNYKHAGELAIEEHLRIAPYR
ncbi:Imm63 family immunity protein [Gottfriedia luciferensis]|uniref:Imm63 family immunity protein n=1 Tax=Gottfriedia luciferensis TaxID=178774 RepID=UPI000B43EDDC|nr:Imm63 family immunity protein [Gottfriedia luciferensis]